MKIKCRENYPVKEDSAHFPSEKSVSEEGSFSINRMNLPSDLNKSLLSSDQNGPNIKSMNDKRYLKIRLDISDTGCGIKEENLSKLFMDFGKLDEHSKINA